MNAGARRRTPLLFEARAQMSASCASLPRANLAHFKAPHSVTFVKELPETATGKIQKYNLRAQRPAIARQ
jgi:acyl-coenzyme A synthetase/AMP-(fatty) acid ligase